MYTWICLLVSPENMQISVSRRDVENVFVIINLPLWNPCTACILLQLNCRMEQATSTITLKCQLHCMLKLSMQLIICMLQDSGTHFPHLKSVNLSMLNSSVKRDVYQLRGLYHAGNEPCSVLIKHIVLPGIFQVRLAVLPEYHLSPRSCSEYTERYSCWFCSLALEPGRYEQKFISQYFWADLRYAVYISVFCIWIKPIN